MYSPITHLEISRARQADLIREAQQHWLARSFSEPRRGLFERLRSYLGSSGAKQPAARAA